MKRKLLPTFEGLSLVVFWAYSSLYFGKEKKSEFHLTASALKASITQERWNGIFFDEQHVGYSVARTALLNDGRRLMEQRSVFRVSTFGKSQQIVTAGAALSSEEGLLEQFDFLWFQETSNSLLEEQYLESKSSWRLTKPVKKVS